MERWQAPGSIFAPIIAAVPPETKWVGFKVALKEASQHVPILRIAYNVKPKGKFLSQRTLWNRTATWMADSFDKPAARVILQDAPPGEGTVSPSSVIWQMTLVNVKNGLLMPVVPEEYSSAILYVGQTRSTDPGQVGGQQLAYLRHLWADAVLAASPGAIVFGGQHHWEDHWWQPNPGLEGAQRR